MRLSVRTLTGWRFANCDALRSPTDVQHRFEGGIRRLISSPRSAALATDSGGV